MRIYFERTEREREREMRGERERETRAKMGEGMERQRAKAKVCRPQQQEQCLPPPPSSHKNVGSVKQNSCPPIHTHTYTCKVWAGVKACVEGKGVGVCGDRGRDRDMSQPPSILFLFLS